MLKMKLNKLLDSVRDAVSQSMNKSDDEKSKNLEDKIVKLQ